MTSCQLMRSVHFSCAHFYRVRRWSDEQNKSEFGKCFSPHGHGHNYRLECYFSGPISPLTGMIANLKDIDSILDVLKSELDHKHLNYDLPFFKDRVPTTEMLATYCFERLKTLWTHPSAVLLKLRLWEDQNLFSEIGNL